MRNWLRENYFPVGLTVIIAVGMIAIGLKNGWS